jgi:hypothetical protein
MVDNVALLLLFTSTWIFPYHHATSDPFSFVILVTDSWFIELAA